MLAQATRVPTELRKSPETVMNVSIIIPAYNSADTIADTLKSVLSQTMPAWEAIVVDDGSTDATAEIVGQFIDRDSRISLVRQANGGESAARNTGILHAQNDWLLFLDADDWISPLHLERLTGELRSNPELDAVHCGSARVSPDGTKIVEKYSPPVGDLFPVLARRAAFNVHACIVRKSLVDTVGRFDTSLRRLPDWDLWQRVARMGARFGAVREVLAFYRMRPNSVSLDAYQVFKDGLRVLKQGHSPDLRLPNPHPDHADGMPQEGVRREQFYFLSWCAGLLLGSGKDARPLLEAVKDENYPELYPDAVAECIFGAAALPTCQPPDAWEKLWQNIQPQVEGFLLALEEKSQAPALAERTIFYLKRMILKHSETWGSIIDDIEREKFSAQREQEEQRQINERQKIQIEELLSTKSALEKERSELQQTISDQMTETTAAVALQALLSEEKAKLETKNEELRKLVNKTDAERNALLHSPEQQLGSFLLNRSRLRVPLFAISSVWLRFRQWVVRRRLTLAGRSAVRNDKCRVIATVCDSFPIYSQTFVYQELMQLIRNGFDVQLIYSKLDSKDHLPSDFGQLWDAKRRLYLDRGNHERAFNYYRKRKPEKIERLIQLLCESSGFERDFLITHDNFLQAFSFTRMVEAYGANYLHSYFFYDRSLMALIAGYLLDIPRGVSCYADHLLQDYELKVVPLHLELCDVVVATSKHIKEELLQLAPHADPNRIIVKPNAIDAQRFPEFVRIEPTNGSPFRLISVCRLEPKKGLLDLVEATSLLKERGLNVELHIVGGVDEWSLASRDYKAKLDQRITELGLWGTVHLEGRHKPDGILRFLRLSHLFVAPFVETEDGDKDGIPTALLEALSTGLPAVASNIGSITEVVDDGKNGVLVPQRDPVQLSKAIEKLLLDPEQRQSLGREAAADVRRRYDVTVCEGFFHELIKTTLGGDTSRVKH